MPTFYILFLALSGLCLPTLIIIIIVAVENIYPFDFSGLNVLNNLE